MKIVTISAPGKLHLSGEHAVVYGKPAVLVAIDKRLRVTLSHQPSAIRYQTEKKDFRLSGNDKKSGNNNISIIRKSDKYIDYICKIFERNYQLSINNYQLSIKSDIPQSRGMGSSAALAAALIAALTKWYGKPWNITQINELAFQAEKFVHTNSSGGDVSIVCYGGILWYRREFDFLKTFWALPFKFPPQFSRFVFFDTGRTESTGDMVKMISSKFKVRSSKIKTDFQEIEEITRQIILAIKSANEQLFKKLIQQNEMLLEELGVVSPKVKRLIREIEKNRGVAKISGAGGIKTGSGIVVGYHKNHKILISLAQKHNYPYFQVKLGTEGVRIEKISV